MPLISVIVPVYNGEKTILKAVQSVLDQTLTDFELIVVNDGSTDATGELLSTLQDDRLTILSQANQGVSASRNAGIAQAMGDYIAFLDADDWWTPNKLERQFNALHDHPQAAIAYSWTDYWDESGNFLHGGDRPTASGKVYEKLLVKNFLDSGSNPLIRKDALLKVGTFDESLAYGEDWELWVRLAAHYEFVVVPEAQIQYRVSAQSASANLHQVEQQTRKVIDRLFEQAPATAQPLKQQSLSNFYQYLMFRRLEPPITRQAAWQAGQYWSRAIAHDPTLLTRRTKLMLIMAAKITTNLFSRPNSVQD